jgi:hypothetical protein
VRVGGSQKRGFLDVTELFIVWGARCADEVGDESLLAQVVNSTDADGNSPLHWAARKGHMEVAKSLLEAGANVNVQNLEAATPLHWAARKNHGELLALLLGANADTELQNKWGATPLAQAEGFGQAVAVSLLQAEVQRRRGGGKQPSKASPSKLPPKPKPAWGEGSVGGPRRESLSGGAKPPKLRAQQDERRRQSEKRRQEAVKKRDQLDDQAHVDQELRRRRQKVELTIQELMDRIDGPITLLEASYEGKADRRSVWARRRAASPTKSPPKLTVTRDLAEAIKEAKQLDVAAPVITAAEERLKIGEEQRKAAKKAKAEAAAAAAKDKDPNAEMAKMERKLQKKMGR